MHISLLCKLQVNQPHRPCHSQWCDCKDCWRLEIPKPCECWCHKKDATKLYIVEDEEINAFHR